MTDREEAAALSEADRALCEMAEQKANLFHASAAWGFDETGAVLGKLVERIRELSRKLAAAEADADRLAEALGQAQHFMERAFTDPDSLKDRLSTMDCFADQLGRNRDALAAHAARLING